MELGLSEFGAWDGRYGPPIEMLDILTDSYIRRKRFESKLLAIEIWTLLGEAMKSKDAPKQGSMMSLATQGFGIKV